MINGKLVRQLRKQHGMTETSLANEVGCAQSLIHRIENGRVMRSKYLYELARALGVTGPELIEGGAGDSAGMGVAEDRAVYLVDPPKQKSGLSVNALRAIRAIEDAAKSGELSDADLKMLTQLASRLAQANK